MVTNTYMYIYSLSYQMEYEVYMVCTTDLIQKSHNAPVPYPTMHHSEQKYAHFCSEWCIVGYGTGAVWDLRLVYLQAMIRVYTPYVSSDMQWLT